MSPPPRRTPFAVLRTPGRRAMAAACACAAFLALASPAAAQKGTFVEGLRQFIAAVPGTYGDEGPALLLALDVMERGLAAWDRSVAAAAAELESQAASAAPDRAADLRLRLARLLLDRHRPTDALRQLDLACALDPDRAELHLWRGHALDAQDRRAAAGEAFAAAWRLDRGDPIAAYYAARGGALSASDAHAALEVLSRAYERVVQRATEEPRAPFARLTLLDDGADGEPAIPHAAYAAGYALIARGELADGIAELRRAAGADPLIVDPAAGTKPLALGAAALRASRLEEARRQLESVLAAAPGSSEAHRLLGLVQWASGNDARAIAHLEQAIRARPADERARITLARVFTAAGRPADAERTLRAAVRDLPDSRLAHWWLRWGDEAANRIADARRALAAVVAPGVLRGLGGMYASVGRLARTEADFASALDAFGARVRVEPNSAAAHRDLAFIYLEQDRPDAALRELIAAVLIDSREANAHAAIGRLHLDAGRPGQAVPALRRALELTPDRPDAIYALAAALRQTGRADEAARALEAFQRIQEAALDERRRTMASEVRAEGARLRGAAEAGESQPSPAAGSTPSR